MRRRVLFLLLAGVLVLAGLAAIGIGVAQRTVWLPESEVTATARLSADVPLAVTEPGVLEMRDGPVTVTVTTESPDAPAVIAVGREADVQAWVEGAAHARLSGLADESRLAVETVEGETEVPDPGTSSDLWTEQETGVGGVTYVYDPPEGRWLLLAAANGTVPGLTELTMTWPREVSTPWSVPLIVAGSVLLALGAGLLGWLAYSGQLLPRRGSAPAGTAPPKAPTSEREAP